MSSNIDPARAGEELERKTEEFINGNNLNMKDVKITTTCNDHSFIITAYIAY